MTSQDLIILTLAITIQFVSSILVLSIQCLVDSFLWVVFFPFIHSCGASGNFDVILPLAFRCVLASCYEAVSVGQSGSPSAWQ